MSGILQALLGACSGAGPRGQTLYTGSGSSGVATQYSFVVPANVTMISAVCIGAQITRGTFSGGTNLVSSGAYLAASTIGGDVGGGSGGQPGALGSTVSPKVGGGGAGGYSGNGGNGATNAGDVWIAAQNGAGGGGAGGSSNQMGGGTGVLGQGANGVAPAGAGSGGSGATYGGGSNGYTNGSSPYQQLNTTAGKALRYRNNIPVTPGETLTVYMQPSGFSGYYTEGQTACRIIWGTARFFPSTNTGDV